MNNKWAVLIAFLSVLTIWRFYKPQKQMSSIKATIEQPFTVTLPSNPTTGYSWQIESYDQEFVEPLHHEYKRAETQRVGSGGIDEFIFKALKVGSTNIGFAYKRPWEKEKSAAKYEKVNVIIQ